MRLGRCISLCLALLGGSAVSVAAPAEPNVIIHAGSLLAVPGEPAKKNQTLVIRDGRIVAVRDGFISAAEAGLQGPFELIDLSTRFVLPGMIDLHVHLTTEAAEGEALRVVTRNAADLALVARGHARETLDAGFTTVLDLGTARAAHADAIRALKAAIEAGTVSGPRVLSVGSPISTPGSSRTGRFAGEVEAAVGPEGVCSGPDDCRRAVREQVALGADVINFYNTGSLGDLRIVEQAMTPAEMSAVVETAHALGRKVVADGHTAAGINAAVRAGADIIDTGPWADAESFRLMKQHGVYFEPHMHAFVVAVGSSRSGSTTVADEPESPILKRLRAVLDRPFSAQEAHESGVPLAYGSDTGIVRHGDNAGDLRELVKIGLTPMQAIQVATLRSAAALGLQAEIGSLLPGKRADVIATDRDPFVDVEALGAVSFVMREGHVFKNR
ncbi:MAG: amidohydrolase family protein [Gammaproteobacteria bacterium]